MLTKKEKYIDRKVRRQNEINTNEKLYIYHRGRSIGGKKERRKSTMVSKMVRKKSKNCKMITLNYYIEGKFASLKPILLR